MELQAKNPRPLSLVSEVRRSSAPSIRSFQSSETAVSRATFASDTDHKRYPRPKQWFPTFLRPRVVGAIIALTLGYATAVEFALWRSQYHNGWRTRGLEQFGSVNFLKSVLPVAVVMPLVMLYDSMHELLLQLQAHVVLSKGRAKARETVLLSYQGGRFSTIQTALINRHWIVLSSAVLSMICLLLSPLASGLLTTKPAEVQYPNYMVTMKKRLGLDPEILTLEHFAAGAGYAEAAVYHNLSDPPFVYNLHWAIAEFVVPPKPSYAANATVIVPTVAVETECNCDQADSVDLTLASAPGGNHTFNGKWYDCTITLQIPDEGIDQYGVETIMECPSNAAQPPWFKPITFWFFSSEIKQVAMVFCQPKISVYNVLVEADLGTGLLKEVTVLDQNVPKNEMSGEPMNGRGYNGIAFDMSQAGRYGPARAISIQTGLPAAIHKLAQTSPGGVPAVMKNVDGFWWLTKMTYTRYLSIVAKSAYFVDDHDTINSIFENYEIRIFVYPLAAHVATGVLLSIAILGALVHFFHARDRRNVYIACNPETIASTISMSSHSKFAALLDAADSESTIAEKLKGMKFGISKRTWQVAAYGEDEHAYGFGEVSSPDFVASPASHGKEKQYFNDPYGTEGNFDESRSSLLSDSSSTVTASHRESTYGKGLPPSR